jgi:hypothetical protein
VPCTTTTSARKSWPTSFSPKAGPTWASDEDWIWVTYVFLARHENLRRVMRERLPNPYLTFQKVIADAIEDGEIPAQDLALATAMITGVIIQVIDSKILGQIRGRLAARADHVAAACVNLLRA